MVLFPEQLNKEWEIFHRVHFRLHSNSEFTPRKSNSRRKISSWNDGKMVKGRKKNIFFFNPQFEFTHNIQIISISLEKHQLTFLSISFTAIRWIHSLLLVMNKKISYFWVCCVCDGDGARTKKSERREKKYNFNIFMYHQWFPISGYDFSMNKLCYLCHLHIIWKFTCFCYCWYCSLVCYALLRRYFSRYVTWDFVKTSRSRMKSDFSVTLWLLWFLWKADFIFIFVVVLILMKFFNLFQWISLHIFPISIPSEKQFSSTI